VNSLRKSLPTAAEYLAAERTAAYKSEYVRGEVFAMSGAALNHNRIAMNLSREISAQLKDRPCEVVGSEMKVRVELADCFFYPDLSGLCGDYEFYDERTDTYINPQFITEILSDRTERHDRGGKFQDYQTIPSLNEYVLVSQKSATVEVFAKRGDHWIYQSILGLDANLVLESVGCEIPLSEIYRNVDFEMA
jgi:Uma2 family endonuclease